MVDSELCDSSCIVLDRHVFSIHDFMDFNGGRDTNLLNENATIFMKSSGVVQCHREVETFLREDALYWIPYEETDN
jgi:hypothetical protein